MGGDELAVHRVFQTKISQHLQGRPEVGERRARMVEEEPIQTTGIEHIHVRLDGFDRRLCYVHCLPSTVFQSTTTTAYTPPETNIIAKMLSKIFWHRRIRQTIKYFAFKQ